MSQSLATSATRRVVANGKYTLPYPELNMNFDYVAERVEFDLPCNGYVVLSSCKGAVGAIADESVGVGVCASIYNRTEHST